MSKIRKLYIIGIIISALILPVALIFGMFLLMHIIKISPITLTLDYYANIGLEGYVSLYLSFLSIEISAILAIVIYQLQYNNEKRAEREEISRAKRTLRVLLTNATSRAFEVYNIKDESDYGKEYHIVPFHFVRITDNHIGLIAVLGHLMTEEEFLYLNRLMETLKDMGEYEKSEDLYEANATLKKYMKLITLPFYPLYHFKMNHVQSIYDVMCQESINIFNLLEDKSIKREFTYGDKYNSNGQILFNNSAKGYFKVYDPSGNVLCNAMIDREGIIEGQAQELDDSNCLEFEGEFRDRKRWGKGTEYFTFRESSGDLKRVGNWKDNKFISGTAYNVILNNTGEEPKINEDEEYNQLYDSGYYPWTLTENKNNFQVGNIEIDNGQINMIKHSIMPLDDLLRKKGYLTYEDWEQAYLSE